ncbi:hypothetical protein [Streptomyces sp. NPDC058268]
MTDTLRTPQVPYGHGLDGAEERLHEEFATGDIPGFVHRGLLR